MDDPIDGFTHAPAPAAVKAVPEASARSTRAVDWLVREPFLLVLLAADAVILCFRLPDYVQSDTWLSLVGGRLVAKDGLPRHETLTVWAHGHTWIDQQWLGQLLLYWLHAARRPQVAARRTCVAAHNRVFSGADVRTAERRHVEKRRPRWDRRALRCAPELGRADANLCVPVLRRTLLASRVRYAATVPAHVPRHSAPRRLGERPRLGGARGRARRPVGLRRARACRAKARCLGDRLRARGRAADRRSPYSSRPTASRWSTTTTPCWARATFRDLVTEWQGSDLPGAGAVLRPRGREHLAGRAEAPAAEPVRAPRPGLHDVRRVRRHPQHGLVRARGSHGRPARARRPLAGRAMRRFAGGSTSPCRSAVSSCWSGPSRSRPLGRARGTSATIPTAQLRRSRRSRQGIPRSAFSRTSEFADWLLWKVPALQGRVAFDARFELLSPAQLRSVARLPPAHPATRSGGGLPRPRAGSRDRRLRDSGRPQGTGRGVLYRDPYVAVLRRAARS